MATHAAANDPYETSCMREPQAFIEVEPPCIDIEFFKPVLFDIESLFEILDRTSRHAIVLKSFFFAVSGDCMLGESASS